jgi:hypothetical protein
MTDRRRDRFMGGLRRAVFLCFSGIFLVLWASSNAGAQITPEVSITCQPSIVELDVSPGQTGEGISNCQVENKALYEVTVELTISDASDNIDTTLGYTSLVIPGSGMEEVDVTFAADIRSPSESTSFEINATITKAGVIPINELVQPSTNANIKVEIMDFIDFEYTSTGLTLSSVPGESFNISAKVRNTGNIHIEVDFIVSNAAELGLKGVNCVPTLPIIELETSAYTDQVVMQCSVSDEFKETEELKIKVYAKATGEGLEKSSEDAYVIVAISVAENGGFGGLGGLTDDISEENMKIIYAGGGLLALLVVIIILVKVMKRGGSSASAEWDDDDLDFEF